MMRALAFEVDWLPGSDSDPAAANTFGALTVCINGEPATEVEDSIAKTLRRKIYVPLEPLARWFLLNWWRLRWEPFRKGSDFRVAHSLAAISGDYAWPAIEMASDGERIQIRHRAERSSDAAAVRYTRSIRTEIGAADFERDVDAMLDMVEARLASFAITSLTELRKELNEERNDPNLRVACRAQAVAGLNSGEAGLDWLNAFTSLQGRVGELATDEVLAVLPGTQISEASRLVDAIASGTTSVDLSWVPQASSSAPSTSEEPWQRAARAARQVRAAIAVGSEPLSNERLGELLGTRLPLTRASGSSVLRGGFQNGAGLKATRILNQSSILPSQRFFLARLIGAATLAQPDEHLLAVTNAYTATQKFERAFAQELLCPWSQLEAFANAEGTDDEAIAVAADHFQVSELVVRTALVNRHKISRDRLPEN